MIGRILAGLAVSLALLAGAPTPPPQSSETYTERETGIRFPRRMVPPGGEVEQAIAGAGVRTKFWFDVYAVALHVEPLPAWDELVDWRRTSSKDLEDDDDFFVDLMSDKVPKTLTLIMARDVDAEDMRSAFEDALEPRVKATRSHAERAAGLSALRTFKTFFDREYVEGTKMVLAARPGGRLTVTVNDRSKGSVTSTALVQALFDVYLGDDPISGNARDAMGRGMAAVFVRGRELSDARAEAEAAEEAARQAGDGEPVGSDQARADLDAAHEAWRAAEDARRLADAEARLQEHAPQGERLVKLLIEADGLLNAMDALVDPLAEGAQAVQERVLGFAAHDGLIAWLSGEQLPEPPRLAAIDTAARWEALREWLRAVHGRLLEHARGTALAG